MTRGKALKLLIAEGVKEARVRDVAGDLLLNEFCVGYSRCRLLPLQLLYFFLKRGVYL